MRIAFFEDDPDWSSAICEILAYEGHTVTAFFDVDRPFDELDVFDMIICDNKIKEQNSGIEYISEARRSGFKGILVLYTSFPKESLASRCEEVDAFLVSKVDDISYAVERVSRVDSAMRI